MEKDQVNHTGFVELLFKIAGVDSRTQELGPDGKFKTSRTTSFFKFPRPKIYRGSGSSKLNSNPNVIKGGNRE